MERIVYIGDVIEERSDKMAIVLSRGDEKLRRSLTFLLREMIRNVPEHSGAGEVWICAQYWASYQLVELALLDEGVGIKESLLQNPAYKKMISNDKKALVFALQPGISRSFSPADRNNNDDDYWRNSGYGLYMASELCANLGGSFIIASGNSALKRYKYYDRQKAQNIPTFFNGTVVQLRISTSEIANYELVKTEILKDGEKIVQSNRKAFLHASQSSRGL